MLALETRGPWYEPQSSNFNCVGNEDFENKIYTEMCLDTIIITDWCLLWYIYRPVRMKQDCVQVTALW